MRTIINTWLLEKPSPNTILMMLLMYIGIGASVSGCTSAPVISKPDDFLIKMEGDSTKPKSIFVFLDGTGNDKASQTNVWRLFEKLKQYKNLQTSGRYIPGVGSIEEELEDDPMLPFLGDALGMGMQTRILEGYDFIAENYNPGDKIYIFGFSRGAHQARALAGLIAYAGIPKKIAGDNDDRKKKWEDILKLVKDKRDEDYKDQWKHWKSSQASLLADEIKNNQNIAIDMQAAEITFLGIWDTVPGSSLKNYNDCKENIGFVKKYLHWIPGISKGERYKSGSYPSIRRIAHAVSLDEQRSKFNPLLVCRETGQTYPQIDETWFPGAHADVGGGYKDSKALPSISLNWMIALLEDSYTFKSKPSKAEEEDAKGLAHWSMGDPPANIGSDCKDRRIPSNAKIHESFGARKSSGLVPILVKGKKLSLPYPAECVTMLNLKREL